MYVGWGAGGGAQVNGGRCVCALVSVHICMNVYFHGKG